MKFCFTTHNINLVISYLENLYFYTQRQVITDNTSHSEVLSSKSTCKVIMATLYSYRCLKYSCSSLRILSFSLNYKMTSHENGKRN